MDDGPWSITIQYLSEKYNRLKLFKTLLAAVLIMAGVSSCKSSKEAVDQYRYFDKNLDTLNTLVNQMKEPIILEGDQLDIQVFSGTLNQEQVQVFVLPSEQRTGYQVDASGDINMPVIGKIHVEGLEKRELEKQLLEKLAPYVKNPVVNISFLNFKVLVVGEVTIQGFQVMSEKSTVLDAIGMAKGMTDAGQRTNVLLIRQLPSGKKHYEKLNLNDAAVFASPYFQVQQNDVVYVQPNDSKMAVYARSNNPFFRDLPVYLSLLTSMLAIISVTIALTR